MLCVLCYVWEDVSRQKVALIPCRAGLVYSSMAPIPPHPNSPNQPHPTPPHPTPPHTTPQAVELFLEEKIGYMDIVPVIERCCEAHRDEF